MQPGSIPILELIFLLIFQYLIAGGMVSFAVLSPLREEKAFPGEMKISLYPRLMHRERLHFMLLLILLQIALIVLDASFIRGPVFQWFGEGNPVLRFGGAAPVLVLFLLMIAAGVGGIGAAARNPTGMAYVVSFLFIPFYMIVRPFSGILVRLVKLVYPGLRSQLSSPMFIISASEEHGEGFLEKDGNLLMHSIVEFGEKRVREVMVPRIDVFALDQQMEIEEIREKVAEAGHSRVPIYENSIDRIVGILYVKDLVRRYPDEESMGIRKYLREAYFVPESKKIDILLREFQMSKKHIAVVVDEYGGTSGIVTLEDILEEIVGDIMDEYDHEPPMIRQTGKNVYAVEGRIGLEELKESAGVLLQAEDVDTLGGFLYDLIGRVPEEGEQIDYQGIRFKINKLDGQRISEVLMELSADDRK